MTNKIQLHKNDLPDDLNLGNILALDGEFMGLNVRRDPLCLIQVSSGNSDAHIIQFDRNNYNAPNLVKILKEFGFIKFMFEKTSIFSNGTDMGFTRGSKCIPLDKHFTSL